MKKNYTLIGLFVLCAVLMISAGVNGQPAADVQWEDHFDDAAQDYLLNNVGWLRYSDDDGLVGQQLYQTDDQKAFLKSGVFNAIVGAGIIETNGVAFINPEDMDATEAQMIEQSEFLDPNQEITFNVNFKKISLVDGGAYTTGTFFLLGARIQTRDDDAYPDPTVDSTYALIIAPLANMTAIVKFAGELNVLNPAAWTWLTPQSTDFEYDLGVTYWVKFRLEGAELKAKVWEGEESDEEDEWLLEATDPEPRVNGVFLEFGLLGDPIEDGDEMILDDVVVKFIEGAGVESDINTVKEFALADNYPNPFNPSTTIEYSLEKAGNVSLNVYSVTGKLVQTLVNAYQPAGSHSVMFNGADADGNTLPSGVYFYTLKNDAQTITKKMILAK